MVPGERDIPHLDRRAFFDQEVDRNRRRRNRLDVRLHRRKLVPVLRQQGPDHVDRPRQLGRIIRSFHREARDMFLLEAVQHV